MKHINAQRVKERRPRAGLWGTNVLTLHHNVYTIQQHIATVQKGEEGNQ